MYGVGLSLGSCDPLDRAHLSKLKALVDRFEPGLVSGHLCCSSVDQRHFHDLLPVPYNAETLRHVSERIDATQSFLTRQILIETITSYVQPITAKRLSKRWCVLIRQICIALPTGYHATARSLKTSCRKPLAAYGSRGINYATKKQ